MPHPYISNLRLCSAFRGVNPPIQTCITVSSDNTLYVIDDEDSKSSRFAASIPEVEIKCFIADNPKGDDLHLIAIDNKLINSRPGGIADCALFNHGKFLFIEFKTNAEGNTDKSVEETYQCAIRQLKATIDLFETKLAGVSIDFKRHIEIVANVVVAQRFPRASALEQSLSLSFFNATGVELSFDGQAQFL